MHCQKLLIDTHFVVDNVSDSSLLNVSRVEYDSMPVSPLTDALHGAGDVIASSFVDPTTFDIHTRLDSSWNEDILR